MLSGFLESLVGPMSGTTMVAIAVTMLIAGFLRGFVGFGSSMIIVLVFSQVLAPKVAVAIACLSGVPALIQLMPVVMRQSERSFCIPFGLASFLAAPVGTWVLVSVNADVMRIAIAVFVLTMVVMLNSDWRPRRTGGAGLFVAAGLASGLVQGSAGVGGPPAVAVALSLPGSPQQQRANVIGAVAALSLCGFLPLWYHDLFTAQVVVISLLLVPLYSGATWVGARFFSQRGHRHFRTAALLALAVIGLVALVQSTRNYLGG